MPEPAQTRLRCLLLASLAGPEAGRIQEAVKLAAQDARVVLVAPDETERSGLLAELVRTDLVIAVLSSFGSDVLYEVGLAHAAGKPVTFLLDDQAPLPLVAARSQNLVFDRSPDGKCPRFC